MTTRAMMIREIVGTEDLAAKVQVLDEFHEGDLLSYARRLPALLGRTSGTCVRAGAGSGGD
jgi:hypothetical protein